MRYLLAICLLMSGAFAATEPPAIPPDAPPGAIVVEVPSGKKGGETNWVCISKTGFEVTMPVRKGEKTSSRMKRAGEILKAFSEKVEDDEEAADKAIKDAVKKKPKEPRPNDEPRPKTEVKRDPNTTWYIDRSDDLVMFCKIPIAKVSTK